MSAYKVRLKFLSSKPIQSNGFERFRLSSDRQFFVARTPDIRLQESALLMVRALKELGQYRALIHYLVLLDLRVRYRSV